MSRLQIGLASVTLLLAACAGDDHRDLQQFVAQSGDELRGRVPAVAQIKTPDNSVYRVARGNRIGQNFGAVALVTESAVTLSEHVQEGGGLWVERTVSLQLLEQTDSR